MAVDPLRKVPINRGEQIQREPIEIGKGVKLYDVDLAIAEHMMDTVVPSVEIMKEKILKIAFRHFCVTDILTDIPNVDLPSH